MIGRIATFLPPLAAVFALGLVLAGPGAARPLLAARVLGVPVEGAPAFALRLEVARRASAVDDAAQLDGVRVEATTEGGPLSPWEGATGPDGVAEALLQGKTPHRWVDVRVLRAGAVLAEGRIALGAAAPVTAPPPRIHGTQTGSLRVAVESLRGALAAPFQGALRIHVTDAAGGQPVPRAVLQLSGGDALEAPGPTPTDELGGATVDVVPRFHEVELAVSARSADGREGRWEGALPIVPGAMWMAPSKGDGEIALVSPVPRARAYVSLMSEEGRLLGAIVAMTETHDGFATGTLRLPAWEQAPRSLCVIVAGDARELGAGTIAWPVIPATGAASPRRLELLLDGMPAAERREAKRAAGVRGWAFAVIALSGVAELLLLVRLNRRAGRALADHLAATSTAEAPISAADRARIGASARGRLPALPVVVALVVLAFGVLAAVALSR